MRWWPRATPGIDAACGVVAPAGNAILLQSNITLRQGGIKAKIGLKLLRALPLPKRRVRRGRSGGGLAVLPGEQQLLLQVVLREGLLQDRPVPVGVLDPGAAVAGREHERDRPFARGPRRPGRSARRRRSRRGWRGRRFSRSTASSAAARRAAGPITSQPKSSSMSSRRSEIAASSSTTRTRKPLRSSAARHAVAHSVPFSLSFGRIGQGRRPRPRRAPNAAQAVRKVRRISHCASTGPERQAPGRRAIQACELAESASA